MQLEKMCYGYNGRDTRALSVQLFLNIYLSVYSWIPDKFDLHRLCNKLFCDNILKQLWFV